MTYSNQSLDWKVHKDTSKDSEEVEKVEENIPNTQPQDQESTKPITHQTETKSTALFS